MHGAEDTVIVFNGREIALSEGVYLKDPSDWSEELAVHLSEGDGIRLTDDHWAVIHEIRAYYERFQVVPMPALIVKFLNKKRRAGAFTIRHYYTLFSSTSYACRYAGLMPSGCI